MAPVGYLETGVIYCDDDLHRLSQFPAECVDLIYLDPPFFSNRQYEVIWGDEAEVRSSENRWEGGVQVYVQWMRERVMEMRRVLKPTGRTKPRSASGSPCASRATSTSTTPPTRASTTRAIGLERSHV